MQRGLYKYASTGEKFDASRAAIWGGTSMVVGQVVKKTAELHDEQQARIGGLLSRVEKTAAQMSALHARVAALERKTAKDK